jgi:hypothetical protein
MNTAIAMISMLIDHIGVIFYPGNDILRIIGRLAFPLYCWFLVQGYQYTRSHKNYMLRLAMLAIISQVPFTLAFGEYALNVIVTLLLGLIALYAYDRIQGDMKMVAVLMIMAVSVIVPMDYGIYGILLIFIYRFAKGWKMVAGHLLLNLLYLLVYGTGAWIQMFSILATLLIVYPLPFRKEWIPRWFYRAFYPAHLIVIYAIHEFIKTDLFIH